MKNRFLISGFLILCFVSPSIMGSALKIPPYLVEVTKESAVIACHLTSPSGIQVIVFDDSAPRLFESKEAVSTHFVPVTGLYPSRIYRYEIRDTDDRPITPPKDPSYIIKTAARRGEAFNFAVFGDPRPGDTGTYRNHEEIIHQIKSLNPHFLIILGDMVDNGSREELWNQFFLTESEVIRGASIFPVFGDNDYAGGKGLYPSYFPGNAKGYYQFEWGGIHFFALNAWDTMGAQNRSEFDEKSPQYQWISGELAKKESQSALYRIVFLHDPVYINRGRSSDVIRKTYMPLFEKNRVDVVLASWHLYERSFSKGIYYFISGGGGAEIIFMKPNASFPSQIAVNKHHFLNMSVNESGMTVQAISKNGTLIDSITIAPKQNREYLSEQMEMFRKLAEVHTFSFDHAPPDTPVLPVYLFSHGCDYCKKLLDHELSRWSNTHQVALKVFHFDLSRHPKVYELFTRTAQAFGRPDVDLPSIFTGDMVLSGEMEIDPIFPEELNIFKENPSDYMKKAIDPFNAAPENEKNKDHSPAESSSHSMGDIIKNGFYHAISQVLFFPFVFFLPYVRFTGYSRRKSLLLLGIFLLSLYGSTLVSAILFFQTSDMIRSAPFIPTAMKAILAVISSLFCLLALKKLLFSKKSRGRTDNTARTDAIFRSISVCLGVATGFFIATQSNKMFYQMAAMLTDPDSRLAACGQLSAYILSVSIPISVICLALTRLRSPAKEKNDEAL